MYCRGLYLNSSLGSKITDSASVSELSTSTRSLWDRCSSAATSGPLWNKTHIATLIKPAISIPPHSAGVPQRETVLCVNAVTLAALDRLKRRTVATLVTQPNQIQKRSTRWTQQLGHFTRFQAPIGKAVYQSVTKEPFSNLGGYRDCQDQNQCLTLKHLWHYFSHDS